MSIGLTAGLLQWGWLERSLAGENGVHRRWPPLTATLCGSHTVKIERSCDLAEAPAARVLVADACDHIGRNVPLRPVFLGPGGDRFRTAITRATTAAGVPTFSPHDLRHRRISLPGSSTLVVRVRARKIGALDRGGSAAAIFSWLNTLVSGSEPECQGCSGEGQRAVRVGGAVP
jgi:hypothetical protein